MKATHPMRLIAIKHAQAGDVVYLHPEHKKYSYEHMGIVQHAPTALTVVLTADASICIADMERCVEVVGRRLLARCAGLTERRIDEACKEAKEGRLIALQGLGNGDTGPFDQNAHYESADEPQAQEAGITAMPDAEHDLSKPEWVKVNEVTGEEGKPSWAQSSIGQGDQSDNDAPFNDVD